MLGWYSTSLEMAAATPLPREESVIRRCGVLKARVCVLCDFMMKQGHHTCRIVVVLEVGNLIPAFGSVTIKKS